MKLRNINGPWEKNSFGYHPLDRDKKKPKECKKVKDKLEPLVVEGRHSSPERDEFYKLSYAWHKTSASLKFPAKMGKNAKRFLSADEESELNKLITEDKNKLLRQNARLALLHEIRDSNFTESLDNGLDESGKKTKNNSSHIVQKVLKAIKNDGFRGEFITVCLTYTDGAFMKASGIWENFGYTLDLKVLRNFKALGQYFYYMISYKGQEKEVRVYVRKGKRHMDVKDE